MSKRTEGGIAAPAGFRAAGARAGLKKQGLDIALIVSDTPAAMAGVFTTNKVQGATVGLCRERLKSRRGQAIVVNSKNANACTGAQGRRDAERMAALTADALGLTPDLVYVASTGVIGVPLPMDKIAAGIARVVPALSREGADDAMRAIMTTDTREKQTACETVVDGRTVRVGGMAKGAGMIEPNMATMLAFLTTDAAVDPAALQTALADAVGQSFNKITVDGDQSCNDTVLLMANGLAGNTPLTPAHPDWPAFADALNRLTLDLALMIARDGEGATKFVTVRVCGAASDADARRIARSVANSLLVKTSWFGEDPNWGRIIDAAGYAGADMDPERVDIRFDDLLCVRNGCLAPDVSLSALEAVLKQKEFTVRIDLNLGAGTDLAYTCDCSVEYVRINSDYTT